jgi:hypothetical protein
VFSYSRGASRNIGSIEEFDPVDGARESSGALAITV